jgi:hypothetical protein
MTLHNAGTPHAINESLSNHRNDPLPMSFTFR